MNICMFTNTYLPHVGGVARSVHSFTEDLRKIGHNVLVIAPTFPDAEARQCNENGIFRVQAIQNFNGSDFSVRIPLPGIIDKKVSSFQPDIIHSHHPFLLGDAALRMARQYGLPIIFTHHTLYEQYTHYVPFDSEPMKRFVINLATEYANLCNAVIAPSRSIADLLRKRGVEQSLHVVPTGIDTQFFAQGNGTRFKQIHRIPDKILVLGHLGRLAKEKNLPFLAKAVCLFLKDYPEACFLVSGKGDAEEIIQHIFAENRQEGKLIMTGTLTGGELADAYQAMDLFVFASKSETQGLVLTEAMAAATPVIALDASGTREVVINGENGFLLPANTSVEGFAGTIEKYAAFPMPKRQAMRENATKQARQFSRNESVNKLIGLYEETLIEHTANGANRHNSQLEVLINRLEVEWNLLTEKLEAVTETIVGKESGEQR